MLNKASRSFFISESFKVRFRLFFFVTKPREKEKQRERERTTFKLSEERRERREKRRDAMTRRMKFVGVTLLMVLLQILVFVSARSDAMMMMGKRLRWKDVKTRTTLREKQPLTFCDDYRSYTCCTSRDTDRILVHHVEMQRQSVSATCASLFGRFECSKCDARNLGGSNRNNNNNNNSEDDDRFKVCSAYAKQLYRACKEEYFVEGAVGGGVGAGRGSSGLISSGAD